LKYYVVLLVVVVVVVVVDDDEVEFALQFFQNGDDFRVGAAVMQQFGMEANPVQVFHSGCWQYCLREHCKKVSRKNSHFNTTTYF
jgi:hypothetical protein